MDAERIERTCKPKGHDIDFEDLYSRPTRISMPKKQDNVDSAYVYAELVSKIADEMFNKTHLVYIQPEDKFYYWNGRRQVWEPQGNSFLMKLFNSIAPRVMPNKKKTFYDAVFQLKLDVVVPPKLFLPDKNYLYFKNIALDLDILKDAMKNQEHYIQVCLDTEFDSKANPPLLFLQALKTALPDPLEMYDCLQALSSILLIRTQRIEKAFFFLGSGGNGKCQKGSDVVLMSDGTWKEIKNIKIGDKIISPQLDGSSKISNITNIHSRFENDVYDVIEQTRRHRVLYTCAGNHEIPIIRLWTKRTTKNDSTPRLREHKLFNYNAKHISKLKNHKSSMVSFTTPLIEFENPTSPNIDPYCLGV